MCLSNLSSGVGGHFELSFCANSRVSGQGASRTPHRPRLTRNRPPGPNAFAFALRIYLFCAYIYVVKRFSRSRRLNVHRITICLSFVASDSNAMRATEVAV